MRQIILILLTSCASYAQYKAITDDLVIPSETYLSPYLQVWRAITQVMNDYDIEVSNQGAGILQTAWKDNTLETNFTDALDGGNTVKGAKYKVSISVVKGFQGNKEVTKVSISKRQLVEEDFLQGWVEVLPDYITEKVLLYRIGRKIKIDNALQELQRLKQEEVPLEF